MFFVNRNARITFAVSMLAALFLFVSPTGLNAHVSFDDPASSAGQFDVAGVTNINWSHTVGSNPARVLYVAISTSSTTLPAFPSARVTGVTYGGMAMNPVGTQLSSDNRNSVEWYGLVNPLSGSATVDVSLLAGVANYVVGGANSFSGVNQTTPNGAFTSTASTSSTPTIIVPDGVAGDLICDALAISPTGAFMAQDATQLLRWNGRSFFGFAFDIGGGSFEAATSPVTMSWTTNGVDNWALAGFAIKSLSPTAAPVTVAGRVTDTNGRGISKTVLTLQNLSTGELHRAKSNHFGYYTLNDVHSGETYLIRAAHGRFFFEISEQVININDSITGLDFIGMPFGIKQDKKGRYIESEKRK